MDHICDHHDSIYALPDKAGDGDSSSDSCEEVICSIRKSGRRHADSDSEVIDYGENIFNANYGMDDLDAMVPIRRMPKEYDTAALLREMTADTDDAFYVVDLSVVMAKLNRWRDLLPRVVPFYAVKCNEDKAILRLLASSGCGFDCASQAEIQQVLEMGVSPEKIIYANPCKQRSMLQFARSAGVRLMTADNLAELEKIAATFPEAKVVIRIAVDDSKSVCRFNSKFGAAPSEWAPLLQRARELDIDIMGVSFHVGSGCQDLGPFGDAVMSAREFFDLAERYGFHPTLLDCGGGYPGTDSSHLSFHDVAATVSAAIDEYFPVGCGVDIIAEPGRYMVAHSHTYAVSVIAKRELHAEQLADASAIEAFGARHQPGDVDDNCEEIISTEEHKKCREAEIALYVNDGVYGSFNCVVFDHAIVEPHVLSRTDDGTSGTQTRPTKLFGPTCDSIDVVMSSTELPSMSIGDWLYFPDMGAYTRCAASRFNGQGIHTVHYVWSGP